MAGRPKSFDNDTAIDAFVEVFWDRGYEATSIDHLQAAVGIKRGSFYAAFGSKESAFIAAIERYVEDVTKLVVGELEQNPDPRTGLSGMLRQVGAFMTSNNGRGCLLLSALAAPPELCPDHAKKLQSMAEYVMLRIADKASLLVERTTRPMRMDAEAIHAYMTSVLFGLNAMATAGVDDDSILLAAETAADFIEQA
ncbi:TetR/AcrR family transcriptional regulator [Roseibium sp.]|uniref:TetR/AcrR family transcriptional regulator n=1 Tax=Roseibium sp. TaxID=1936156 RepID=UPI003A96D97D